MRVQLATPTPLRNTGTSATRNVTLTQQRQKETRPGRMIAMVLYRWSSEVQRSAVDGVGLEDVQVDPAQLAIIRI